MTLCQSGITIAPMETIIFKVPTGTKAKLKRISPNISELLREETCKLVARRCSGSALDKAGHLVGMFKGGPSDASTSKDYLKQYAQKNSH